MKTIISKYEKNDIGALKRVPFIYLGLAISKILIQAVVLFFLFKYNTISSSTIIVAILLYAVLWIGELITSLVMFVKGLSIRLSEIRDERGKIVSTLTLIFMSIDVLVTAILGFTVIFSAVFLSVAFTLTVIEIVLIIISMVIKGDKE